MSSLPADNFILLSLVNTALRDGEELGDFCARYCAEEQEVAARLAEYGYVYDGENCAFKRL